MLNPLQGTQPVRGTQGDATSQGTAEVRIAGVSKMFRSLSGSVIALADFSMDVAKGEFVSLLGPSGCGKSTLLNLVAGLDRPTRGSITIGGTVVKGPFTRCGIVFQRDLLLEWRTALRNVLLQFELRGENPDKHMNRALELLELVGIQDFRDHYPRQLSGGMRQRVSICRALAHDPELMLMDEPFGALDALTREQLNDDLARICSHTGKTVIFITHSIAEAVFLSDRVVVMSPRPGRVVGEVMVGLGKARDRQLRATPEFSERVRAVRRILDSEG